MLMLVGQVKAQFLDRQESQDFLGPRNAMNYRSLYPEIAGGFRRRNSYSRFIGFQPLQYARETRDLRRRG